MGTATPTCPVPLRPGARSLAGQTTRGPASGTCSHNLPPRVSGCSPLTSLFAPQHNPGALLRPKGPGQVTGSGPTLVCGGPHCWEDSGAGPVLTATPSALHQPDLDSAPADGSRAEPLPAWHQDRQAGSRASAAAQPPARPTQGHPPPTGLARAVRLPMMSRTLPTAWTPQQARPAPRAQAARRTRMPGHLGRGGRPLGHLH